ncbi:hypothetical protein WS71_03025 [Burkholderia mayonis]|uniref:Uncharacterized protein n=1 Tax=Burkholderia mayonis TaxID=1385591 RepID=A0A1B4FRV8_9BURK|nr:hypothetical protein WS71_03025 [Burkholderia mayonis]KVE51645.1 hypothetical protein WS71_11420 [Burkholderia mayonis]
MQWNAVRMRYRLRRAPLFGTDVVNARSPLFAGAPGFRILLLYPVQFRPANDAGRLRATCHEIVSDLSSTMLRCRPSRPVPSIVRMPKHHNSTNHRSI